MTPEERNLVDDLFRRLVELERNPRDPEAERLIGEGLTRAPNAVYALVQTVLLQDEALKTANGRIEALEERLAETEEAAPRGGGKWNTGAVLRGRGSVPSIGNADRPMGVPPAFDRGREAGETYREPDRESYRESPPGGGYGGPFGGGFLGTAAAVAAGAIGGSLLLNGIRSALGGQGDKGPFSGAFDHLTGGKSESGGSSGASGGADDLAREAGLGDIGRAGASDVAGFKDTNFDEDDSVLDDESAEDDFDDDVFDDDDA